jgi:hypothetical protein
MSDVTANQWGGYDEKLSGFCEDAQNPSPYFEHLRGKLCISTAG